MYSLELGFIALATAIFVSWRSVIYPDYSMISPIIRKCRELYRYIAAYGAAAFLIVLVASRLGSLDSIIAIKVHETTGPISLDWFVAFAVGLNTRKAFQKLLTILSGDLGKASWRSLVVNLEKDILRRFGLCAEHKILLYVDERDKYYPADQIRLEILNHLPARAFLSGTEKARFVKKINSAKSGDVPVIVENVR